MGRNKEESVDLNATSRQDLPDQDPTAPVKELNIGRHNTDSGLKATITAGMTNEEILDMVIAAPSESLIPWESVELPSKGLYYGWTSGHIDVRAWSIEVDKILATERLTASGEAFDRIFDHCCKFPAGFSPPDLLVGDQVFLLYYLRGITHGNIYEFVAKTPSTKVSHVYKFNMNELSKTIVYANPSLGNEPFDLTLPYLSQQIGRPFTIGLRFLRVRDTQSISRTQKAKNAAFSDSVAHVRERQPQSLAAARKSALQGRAAPAANRAIPVDDTLARNLEMLVVHVMGSTDRMKIRQVINSNNLHATDAATIRTWLAEHSPSIDTVVDLEDPESGEVFSVALPITESFFRSQE